jgi:hypothetical protein
MSNPILDRIKRGTCNKAHRVVLAGPEGIGKTTFASDAGKVLFIAAEDGLTGFDHVDRFIPTNLEELNGFVDGLIADRNGFNVLAVDTADWLERFLAKAVCARDEKANIEDYGYGKGYVVLENELVSLLQKFDKLRDKGMWIIVLSHVQIKTFNDPTGESWDRYEMKGHKRITGILREWPDAVLFAVREVFRKEDKKTRVEKTIDGGRVMHTEWSPAWDAKNRLNLPPELEFTWDAFAKAVEENSNENLSKRIRALYATSKITDDKKLVWEKALKNLETLNAAKLKAAIEKLEKLQ